MRAPMLVTPSSTDLTSGSMKRSAHLAYQDRVNLKRFFCLFSGAENIAREVTRQVAIHSMLTCLFIKSSAN